MSDQHQPPIVLEAKSTTRYLIALVGGALLCAGLLTWVASSCTGRPPDTQTTGQEIRATLAGMESEFKLVVENVSSKAILVREPQLGECVTPDFRLGNGEVFGAVKPPMSRSAELNVISLAPGEKRTVTVSKEDIRKLRPDARQTMWILFTYEPSAGVAIQSNVVAWYP